MEAFLGEFIGTMLLVLLGNGVVANVLLNKSKGNNGGWIVLALGWGIAVFAGVFTAVELGSEGHLNPAVTLAMSIFGDFPKNQILPYLLAQFLGAALGAFLVWVAYKAHFDETRDGDTKLAVFSTSPEIRNPFLNICTEVIATFVLVFSLSLVSDPEMWLGSFQALPVALVVMGVILSFGGPTGAALNPARDLAPRIIHHFLPIPNKRDSDWEYACVPVVGPIVGASLAMLVIQMM